MLAIKVWVAPSPRGIAHLNVAREVGIGIWQLLGSDPVSLVVRCTGRGGLSATAWIHFALAL